MVKEMNGERSGGRRERRPVERTVVFKFSGQSPVDRAVGFVRAIAEQQRTAADLVDMRRLMAAKNLSVVVTLYEGHDETALAGALAYAEAEIRAGVGAAGGSISGGAFVQLQIIGQRTN